tara:strand:+ start:1297 stop:1557 length:261 start_codon:yes stop_codon:yes gene_type:complete
MYEYEHEYDESIERDYDAMTVKDIHDEVFSLEIGDSMQTQIQMKDNILDFFLFVKQYVNHTGFSIARNLKYNDLIVYYNNMKDSPY